MVETLRPDATLHGVPYMRTDPEGSFVTKDDYDELAEALREAYQITHYGRGSMQDVDDVLERALRLCGLR